MQVQAENAWAKLMLAKAADTGKGLDDLSLQGFMELMHPQKNKDTYNHKLMTILETQYPKEGRGLPGEVSLCKPTPMPKQSTMKPMWP
jgi:hypothetical protein